MQGTLPTVLCGYTHIYSYKYIAIPSNRLDIKYSVTLFKSIFRFSGSQMSICCVGKTEASINTPYTCIVRHI